MGDNLYYNSIRPKYNAPINVMPHYPRYGMRWGKVGICIPVNNNSPPTGEVLAIQTPTYPNISPSSETRGKWGYEGIYMIVHT